MLGRRPGQGLPESSSALANQLLRMDAQRSGDLLDRYKTQVVAWSEREQHVAVPVVPQAQVFVLAGHDLVAVVLEKASHLASTHWRQCESFLFAHNTRSVALCVLPRTRNALARVACNR